VEACPYNALFMGYAFERSKYRRGELVQRNEGLLASTERRASAFMHPELEAELPEQTLLIHELHNNNRKRKKSLTAIQPEKEDNKESLTDQNSKTETK